MIYGYLINEQFCEASINNLENSINNNTLPPELILFFKTRGKDGKTIIKKTSVYRDELIIITGENKLDFAEYLI